MAGSGTRKGIVGRVISATAAGALLDFLLLPIVALLITTGVTDLVAGLHHPLVRPALRLSLLTTSVSLVLVVLPGTALAWLLVRRDGAVSRWVEIAVQLPVVIPPAVGGLALLLAFGRRGLLGASFARFGITVPFTTIAVVLAEVFVSAPFFVLAATAAFRRLDPNLWIATPFVAELVGAA